MPALPAVAAVVKTNLMWTVEGDASAENILFWHYTSGTPTAADLATFAAAIVTEADTAFNDLASNYTGVSSVIARDLASDMGAEAEAGTPWVGTAGTALLPPAAAAVVAHSISRHYRGGHPRTYLPIGVSASVATSGFWTDSFVTAVDSAWGSFVAAITGGSPYGGLDIDKLVNVSYYGPPNRVVTSSTGRVRTVSTLRAAPIVDTITGHVTRKVIGSQRRRNRDA